MLRQGSIMTPEQSNLAKLLSNMRVASAGSDTGVGPPQSLLPQCSSPPAVQGQAARALSTPQQPPSLHQSGMVESALAQDLEEGDASVLPSRPMLLTPKFLAGSQQHQANLPLIMLCFAHLVGALRDNTQPGQQVVLHGRDQSGAFR